MKFAIRSPLRNPGFTFLSIAILALGIGANTAIFSVINGVILRPLAYPDPDRLVSISTAWRGGSNYGQVSGPDFLDYQSQSNVFQSMAAYDDGVESIVANSASEFAGAAAVSSDFLRTIGVEPVAGRAFAEREFLGKPADVALVSGAFWERHFGDTPFKSGLTLKLENTVFEIIGILPRGFHFPEDVTTDVWVPQRELLKETNRGGHNYRVLARLKPGIRLSQAQAQLSAIASRLERQYQGTNKHAGVFLTTLANFSVRRVKTSLFVLLGAVTLVLLIACSNVANLLLARGTSRVRELSIRAALGAGRGRLMRQLSLETALLSAAGCASGLLLAYAALPILVRLAPPFVPRLEEVKIDTPVLLFTVGATLIAAFLFGLAPALQAGQADPNMGLRTSGPRGVLGGTAGLLRNALVTTEIAFSMVLLISAGLLLKSFSAMTSVDMGFRPERLLAAQLSVPSEAPQRANDVFFQPLLRRLARSGEVQSAALTQTIPGDASTRSDGSYIITGQTMNDMTVSAPQAGFSVVSPVYFTTMRIPLLGGRDFSDRDGANAPPVAIISQNLARHSFPHRDPVGQKILCGLDLVSMKWMTIIGVVGNVRMNGPAQPAGPEIYMPYLQHARSGLNVIIRAGVDPASFSGALREYVRALDPAVSMKITTMENHLAEVVSTPRFSTTLVSVFAGLATVLAMMGIYGVMSYSVTRRKPEIGVRMALGADRGDVVRMVLYQALRLTGTGVLIGCLGAIAASRFLESQLFNVSRADPATYVAMLALVVAVAVLSSYLPAWRAAHVEPLEALREE